MKPLIPSRAGLLAFLFVLVLCLAPGAGQAQTIGHALNNPGKTFTSEGTPWVAEVLFTHDGVQSGRSGNITHNQTSSVATTFTGPGTLKFWWKVVSEANFDLGSFRVDGAVVQQISGNVTWAQVSYALPAGQHTVEWRYEKDASISALGEGLFVDEIALIPPVGDAERHIDARVRTASLSGSTLVFNEPGAVDRFKARAVVDVQRLDEVTLPLSVVATAVLPVKIAWSLDDMHTGAPVAVENGEHLFSVSLATHLRFNALPAVAVLDETFSVGGAAPLDINPAWFYRLTLNVSYTDENDNPVAIGTSQLNNLRLVTFSGRFTAGPVEARFISTDWSSAGVVASGDGLGHTFTVFSAPNTAYFVDNPASRFSFNFNTVYRELSTGDLTLRPGSTIPLPQFGGTVANVCYRIENSTLSSTGLSGGSMKVCLPAGTGVTASATARLLESEINFGVVPITSAGLPNFASRTTALPLYLVHEQTPVRYAGPVTWDVAAGTFTMPPAPASYVRKREMEWLAADAAAGLLTVPSAAVKDSNEAPWQRAGGTVGDVVITAAAGGVGVLTASVSLGGPDKTVKLHHPAGVSLPLTGASMISVVNGAFTADSMLNLSGPVAVSYSRDGFDAGECNVTAAGAGTLSMGAANDALIMTSDGGWRAAGTLPAGARIDWGGLHGALPTHRLENAGAVTLLVSGTYLDGNYAAVPEPSRAAALLLSGLGTPEDYTLVERPFTAEFAQGLVDYPGLNVRVSGGVPAASSFLAGHALGPYSLKPYSKYYVTTAGVSGIHDAVTSTLPVPIQLYGYDSMLDGLRLSYLDSQNKESATGGSITLPVPSGFSVAFSELTFTSGGALKAATLPPNSPQVTLDYWQCTFQPDLLEFTPPGRAACTPTSIAYLTLSGRVGLGTISGTPVRGALAFHPNGRLIVPADNLVRGVDSSLPMPPGFALKGRGTLKYPFAPATRLRFNKWPGAGAQPATGFLFVAGKLNVPFFEDLPVLLHLEPANFLQSAHVMGGWPSDPSKPDRGWTVGGKNFFNSTLFDADNIGYEGASLAAFRSGLDAGQKYRPHVHKDWQRIVDLEFPVQWNASSREFAAAGNQTMDLLVLSAQGQLKGLDAAGAEIEFGVKFNNKLVKLPNLNTQSFARALTDSGSLLAGSPEKKLANALTSALTTAISQPLIRDGTAALDHLLDDTLANLLDAPLRAGLDTPLDNLHAALKTIYASTGMAPGPLNAAPEVAQLKTALIAHLQSDLLAAANGPTSITGALDARLAQADAALTELEKLCYFDQPAVDGPPVVVPGQAQNPFLQAIARRALVEFYESDFTTTGSSAAQTAVRKLLKDLLEDARPILRQLTVAIGEARRAIRDMRDSLQGVGGASRNLRGQIEQVFTAANAASNFSTAAVDAFIVQITTSRDASGRWFDEVSPAQFRDRFGALLTDRFRSSALEQQIKQALKRLLDPVRQTAHNALNMVFGQVNNMVNQVVLELVKNFSAQLAGNAAFAELLNGGSALLNEAADGLGNFGKQYNDATKDVIRFAKVEGYARTRGDSLDELRVEAGIGLAVPDEIGASVFVLIKNVQSDMPSTSCRDPGAVATEVTIGANGGISIKSGNASEAPRPFKARLEGRFSFAGDFTPNGLDALIDLESDMDFGALTLKQVRMRLGLGGTEAYATAAARGSVWFVEGEARLFLGATRQLNILEESFDRETYDTVITRPMLPVQAGTRCLMHPVIGIYGQLGAHISVNRFFAIPDTCLLTLRAGRQLSEYVLLSDNASKLNAGIRDVLLINGTALCVGISGQAGLLFNAQLDTAALVKAEGIGSVLGSITGTARGWVEACVDLYFKKFCARADIIVGLKLNPPSFYPIAIEY